MAYHVFRLLPLLTKAKGLQGRFGLYQVRVHVYQTEDIMLLRAQQAYNKDTVLGEAAME